MDMPAAEVDIHPELVAQLVREQHPDLAGPIEFVENGWDNAIFRLGSELAMRMPRRSAAVPLVVGEQRWLPELAAALPVRVPAPVRTGHPSAGYPWPWSIVPWLEGTAASEVDDACRDGIADALAETLACLHVPAPTTGGALAPNVPRNPVRGIPLRRRSSAVLARIEAAGLPDALRRIWRDAASAPEWTGPPLWLHGDLHPANALVAAEVPATGAAPAGGRAIPGGRTQYGEPSRAVGTRLVAAEAPPSGAAQAGAATRSGRRTHGVDSTQAGSMRLVALIDFGDLTAGDPATDLAAGWLFFSPEARARFRAQYERERESDGATWQRARGWALSIASAMAAHSDDNPRLTRLGRAALARVLVP